MLSHVHRGGPREFSPVLCPSGKTTRSFCARSCGLARWTCDLGEDKDAPLVAACLIQAWAAACRRTQTQLRVAAWLIWICDHRTPGRTQVSLCQRLVPRMMLCSAGAFLRPRIKCPSGKTTRGGPMWVKRRDAGFLVPEYVVGHGFPCPRDSLAG